MTRSGDRLQQVWRTRYNSGGLSCRHAEWVVESVGGWKCSFVQQHGVTVEWVMGSLKGASNHREGNRDWAAGASDLTTDSFEHTGIQTVARQCTRQCIRRAAEDVSTQSPSMPMAEQPPLTKEQQWISVSCKSSVGVCSA